MIGARYVATRAISSIFASASASPISMRRCRYAGTNMNRLMKSAFDVFWVPRLRVRKRSARQLRLVFRGQRTEILRRTNDREIDQPEASALAGRKLAKKLIRTLQA